MLQALSVMLLSPHCGSGDPQIAKKDLRGEKALPVPSHVSVFFGRVMSPGGRCCISGSVGPSFYRAKTTDSSSSDSFIQCNAVMYQFVQHQG